MEGNWCTDSQEQVWGRSDQATELLQGSENQDQKSVFSLS